MFSPGDVVKAFSPQASKKKFHLCVCAGSPESAHSFLFLNSETNYAGDCVFADGDIDGLPESRTGDTVVCFERVVRFNEAQLGLFRAEKVSEISADVAGVLLSHARTVQTLSGRDRRIVVAGLEFVTEKNA